MPISPHFDDPEHWRDRAEQTRVLAEQMSDETSKMTMLRVAHDYELLATRAAARLWAWKVASPSIAFLLIWLAMDYF